MACGVHDRELIVRVGRRRTRAAMKEPHVRPFDLSAGRPAKGWILVQPRRAEVSGGAEEMGQTRRGLRSQPAAEVGRDEERAEGGARSPWFRTADPRACGFDYPSSTTMRRASGR
jgi:hypothetical protein